MLNIFGAFGRLLPGYVQGERQAIQDNWQDLSNYNSVQAGQIQNAWNESIFNPSLSMVYDQMLASEMGLLNNGMDLLVNQMAFPGRLGQAGAFSAYGPLAQAGAYAEMMQNWQFPDYLGQAANPGVAQQQPIQQSSALNTPTVARWR